jgi:hypothetical protein
MRNLLAFLAAVVLTVAIFGWYLRWYRVQSVPAQEGHRAVHIDIDSTKIEQDLYEGEQKIHQALEKHNKPATGTHAEESKKDSSKPAPH